MSLTPIWPAAHRHPLRRRLSLLALVPLCWIAYPPVVSIVSAAEPPPTASTARQPDAEDSADADDDTVSLTAYNVKADRIEDFGFRVDSRRFNPNASNPNLVTIWFTKFVPVVTEVTPNTAAAKAGLQPGDRILKSEGQTTAGGLFSTGKFGQWSKIQKKKWAEVAAGKSHVTWTLEVETPGTPGVRTVKMVVPTPAPRWGSSLWRAPEGRKPSVVVEPGPLAERARAVLDNGLWTLLDDALAKEVRPKGSTTTAATASPVTGYVWQLGGRREGLHRMVVTQAGGRTAVFLETASPATGSRVYLTSPSGALEKAGVYTRKKKGEVSLDEARAGFEHERDLWATKVGKVSPRWPMEVIPGYDAHAIFAVLAAHDGTSVTVAPERPLAAEFLKLSPATEVQRQLFAEAYGKLGAEPDRWAYTETSRGPESKHVTVTRVDPSQPEAGRCVLLSLDGQPPTPADVQRWRDDGGDTPKALGDIPPLASVVELKDLRISTEDTTGVVFELPIRTDSAEFPAEKFQALFRVHRAHRAFEEITIKLREGFRVAGVVKVTEAGLHLRFETLDPAYPPQPVLLKGGGAARIVFVKFARDFETKRMDFKRVTPFEEAAAK